MMILAAVVLAAICTSCNSGAGCYEITVSGTIGGVSVSNTTYQYCKTAQEADLLKAQAAEVNSEAQKEGVNTTTTVKKVNKSEADCQTILL